MDTKSEEISLKDIFISVGKGLKYLVSKWYILFGSALLFGLIGYFYAKRSTLLYTGTTSFILEGGSDAGGRGLSALSGLGVGGAGGTDALFQGESLFELYKSRSILGKTLLGQLNSDELFIQRFYRINKDHRESLLTKPELSKLISDAKFFENPIESQIRTRDSILLQVCATINESYIEVDKLNKKANIINVTISAEDEEFAKRFNEELVNNVNRFYLEVKSGKSADNINTLQRKVDSVKNVMYGAISTTQSATDNTPNLNPTRQSIRNIPIQKAQISSETSFGVLSELMRNLEQAKIATGKDAPIIKIVDNVVYPLPSKKPSPMLFGVIGLIFGGIISIAILISYKIVRRVMQSE